MITQIQKEILDFLDNYKIKNKRSPKLKDIASYFKKSISTIYFHLENLIIKGLVRKDNFGGYERNDFSNLNGAVKIPLLGQISAGYGIENLETSEYVEIPRSLVSDINNHYALKVVGDSMTDEKRLDESILNGDVVIIKYQNIADNGDIVVALFKDEKYEIKATIKKFYNRGDKVELIPLNPNYKSIWVYFGDIEIRGKFVGLIR